MSTSWLQSVLSPVQVEHIPRMGGEFVGIPSVLEYRHQDDLAIGGIGGPAPGVGRASQFCHQVGAAS